MAAETAPDNPRADVPVAAAEFEPRHLQPVPADQPDPDEPIEQSTGVDVADDDGELGEHTDNDLDVGEAGGDEPFEDEPGAGLDLSGWLGSVREVFSPQSGLWTTRPSSPDEVVDRARHGQQVADAGPLRVVSAAHGYASAGMKLVLRAGEWVFCEHLARCLLGLVLLTALCLYPPTAQVLGYALTPLVWVHDLLT